MVTIGIHSRYDLYDWRGEVANGLSQIRLSLYGHSSVLTRGRERGARTGRPGRVFVSNNMFRMTSVSSRNLKSCDLIGETQDQQNMTSYWSPSYLHLGLWRSDFNHIGTHVSLVWYPASSLRYKTEWSWQDTRLKFYNEVSIRISGWVVIVLFSLKD